MYFWFVITVTWSFFTLFLIAYLYILMYFFFVFLTICKQSFYDEIIIWSQNETYSFSVKIYKVGNGYCTPILKMRNWPLNSPFLCAMSKKQINSWLYIPCIQYIWRCFTFVDVKRRCNCHNCSNHWSFFWIFGKQ